jgi:endonuclease/exonuclease/phosphatase family metal-dependent hydrolase
MSQSKRSILDKVIYLFNIVGALALILSYASPYLSPVKFWFISLFGLAYPFLLAANFIFMLYWLIRLKKHIFLSAIAIAMGYFHFKSFVRFNDQNDYPAVNSIKILSHNLRALGLNGPEFQLEDSKKVFNYLDSELFDVYCFQEFFNTHRKDFAPWDSLKRLTGTKYHHVEYLVKFRNNEFGIATLSQYPIINKGIVPFEREGTNICIYTDIDFDGKTVRIYNMHLQSLGLKQQDYDLFQQIDIEKGDEKIEQAKSLVGRLRNAYQQRQDQARIIRKHISDSPHPVIVVGDFNDTPLSYSYRTIKGELIDAFVSNGNGIGNTYNGIFPLLRIDYMLYSPELDNEYFETVRKDLSDHYPLVGYFDLNSN